MLVVVTNTPSPDLPRPRWSDLMDRSLWVIISFQAEPVLSIRTHTRAYTNATGLTCGLPDDARRSSSSGHPYVSIYGNISASVFMHTRVRVIAGTRVFTRREIKYANLRAWASLLASVSDTGTFSSVGLEHMEGFVATLIASQIMNFQVFVGISLFSPWQKRKKKRIFYEWSDEIGYRGERSGVRNSRSIDKYRQMRGSYRLGGQIEENTRF